MNIRTKVSLIMILFLALTVIGQAQEQKSVGEIISSSEKIVIGSPFSAEGISENIQVLADGNKISRKTTTKMYRDNEGRFRREEMTQLGGALGSAVEMSPTIFIMDPTTGFKYYLNTKSKTIRQSTFKKNSGPNFTIKSDDFNLKYDDFKIKSVNEIFKQDKKFEISQNSNNTSNSNGNSNSNSSATSNGNEKDKKQEKKSPRKEEFEKKMAEVRKEIDKELVEVRKQIDEEIADINKIHAEINAKHQLITKKETEYSAESAKQPTDDETKLKKIAEEIIEIKEEIEKLKKDIKKKQNDIKELNKEVADTIAEKNKKVIDEFKELNEREPQKNPDEWAEQVQARAQKFANEQAEKAKARAEKLARQNEKRAERMTKEAQRKTREDQRKTREDEKNSEELVIIGDRQNVEKLGVKNIEGVVAEGTRSVMIINAGSIGNERPIEVVYETWYSKELQMMVYSKHSDPRFGENIYRLTNIKRNEPDSSLFNLPDDYKMVNGGKPPGNATKPRVPNPQVGPNPSIKSPVKIESNPSIKSPVKIEPNAPNISKPVTIEKKPSP